MSRARKITDYNGREHWFDTTLKSMPAKVEHLELLAAAENIEPDDLLEEGLNQGQCLVRLRKALGQGVIPADILERQRARRIEASKAPECRLCSMDGRACEGRITRHHFVTRWLMKELDNYEAYARRDRCTIPVCMGAHRDLHMRLSGFKDKSIARYLTDEERKFTHKMLSELEEQHPKVIELVRGGYPEVSYEAQLIRDYDQGKFARASAEEAAIGSLPVVESVS